MSANNFQGATLDRNRNNIVKVALPGGSGWSISFPLIPYPEGSQITGDWADSVKTEWKKVIEEARKANEHLLNVELSQGRVVFEVPGYLADKLEHSVEEIEKTLKLASDNYKTSQDELQKAKSGNEKKLNDALDRISSK